MRKYVLILLMSVCCIIVYAQKEYESVLEGGKVWKMEYKVSIPSDSGEQYRYENIVLQGDTIIDGIPFKSTGSYWIGQKDGVVYEYDKNSNLGQKFPIMDFTLNVGDELVIYEKDYDDEGDSVETWETERFKVVAVSDTIIASSTDKRLRHCVYVEGSYGNRQDCWVEGIGSLTYGILGDRIYWVGSSKRLFQCTQADEVLYVTRQIPYRQMLEDQKAWVYEKRHFIPISEKDFLYEEQDIPVRFVLDGDTLINGTRYFKLIMHEEGETPSYYCALREQGTAVYVIEKDNTEEALLQEFDIEKFPKYFNDDIEIFGYEDQTDVINVNGKTFLRHRYKPNDPDENDELIAVEGIGFSETALVFGMYPPYYSPSTYADLWVFKSCEQNGETIFSAADFYNNGDTNAIKLTNTKPNRVKNTFFDLQGRPVQSISKHGIYIKNGRKVIR